MTLTNFIFNANTLVGIGTVIFAVAYVIKNFVLGTSKAQLENAVSISSMILTTGASIVEIPKEESKQSV